MFANLSLMGLLVLMYLMSALSTDRQAYKQKVAQHKVLVERQLSTLKYEMAAALRPLSSLAILAEPLDQGRLSFATELLQSEQKKSPVDDFVLIKGKCKAIKAKPESWPSSLRCNTLGLSFVPDRFHTRIIAGKLVMMTTMPVAKTIDNYHLLAIKTLPLSFFHQNLGAKMERRSDFNLSIGPASRSSGSLAVFQGKKGKPIAELTLADGYYGIYPKFLLEHEIFRPAMLPYFYLAAILLALLQLILHRSQIVKIDRDIGVIYKNRLHLGSGNLAGVFNFRSVLKGSMNRLLHEIENLVTEKESKLVAKDLEIQEIAEKSAKVQQSLNTYKNQFHLALISNSANLKTEITFNQLKKLIGNLDNKNSAIFKQQLATMIESAEIMGHMCKEWWHGLQRVSARKFFRNLSETPSKFHGSKLDESLAIIKKVSDQLAISSVQSSLALKKNLARIHDIVQLIYDTSQSKLKMSAEQLTIEAIILNNQNLLNRLSTPKISFQNRADSILASKAVLQIFAPTLADVYFHVFFGLSQHGSAEKQPTIYTESLWRDGAFQARIYVLLSDDVTENSPRRQRASECFAIAKELCRANDISLRVETSPRKSVAVHLTMAESFFTIADSPKAKSHKPLAGFVSARHQPTRQSAEAVERSQTLTGAILATEAAEAAEPVLSASSQKEPHGPTLAGHSDDREKEGGSGTPIAGASSSDAKGEQVQSS